MVNEKMQTIRNKTINTIPSVFTIGNMVCGMMALLNVANENFIQACYFLIASYVMDILDGRIARMINAETEIGIELDSFSDWLSFGIAPAYMIYEFALKEYGIFAYPVVLIYIVCGAIRLARFNLKSIAGESSKTYFQGLPIPAAGGIIIFFVLSYSIIENEAPTKTIKFLSENMPVLYSIFPFIMIVISLLMVSSIPYIAMKSKSTFIVRSPLGIIATISTIFIIVMYPQNALLLFFITYAVSGVVYFIFKTLFQERNSS